MCSSDLAMKILRDKGFIDLLKNYPRAKKEFYIGYEIEDTVESEVMFRAGPTLFRPKDYLEQFVDFVRENEDRKSVV